MFGCRGILRLLSTHCSCKLYPNTFGEWRQNQEGDWMNYLCVTSKHTDLQLVVDSASWSSSAVFKVFPPFNKKEKFPKFSVEEPQSCFIICFLKPCTLARSFFCNLMSEKLSQKPTEAAKSQVNAFKVGLMTNETLRITHRVV